MASDEERVKEFERRIAERREREDGDDKEDAEQLRRDYLRRTGRKEMEP